MSTFLSLLFSLRFSDQFHLYSLLAHCDASKLSLRTHFILWKIVLKQRNNDNAVTSYDPYS